MGSKVTNVHLQESVHVRHTHTAMPAASGSMLALSTICAVRSGVCMGSSDSQFMLLTSKVKCNACFGIRQLMSQKAFMTDCQEEQKARICWLLQEQWPCFVSFNHTVSNYRNMKEFHAEQGTPPLCPCDTEPLIWLKIWENAQQNPENHTERCWCRIPTLIIGPITICLSWARGFTIERCCLCKY